MVLDAPPAGFLAPGTRARTRRQRSGGFLRASWLVPTCALILSACAAPKEKRAGRAPFWPRREVLGHSVQAEPIVAHTFGDGPVTMLLFGVIHGNEPAGRTLLERFMEHVRAHPELCAGRRLVIVPVVNPDGYRTGSRHNANGVDLNRNFPSADWRPMSRNGESPASEPETRALLRLVRQFQPVRILSVHSPLAMVNWDGPARGLAEAMSRACGYPACASVGYPTPGSFGSYSGVDWGTPTITLELGRDVDPGNVWPRFREALEVFVEYPPATTRIARSGAQAHEEES